MSAASYKIVFKRSAEKDLTALPNKDQRRIAECIDALSSAPRPVGCKKLSGPENLWRVRVGDYRVIYQINDRIVTVLVLRIGNRRDVYERR